MIKENYTISDQEKAAYDKNGYLIVRNVLSLHETDNFRRLVQQRAKTNGYPPSLKYPAPGKYTVSGNQMAEAGLASIAEHPTVVNAVECLLGERAYLTAYVAYLRTPGDRGGGAHCDYKRWRPVGSSMNWLFAIVPLTDFDLSYGPLLASPGSHRLTQVIDPDAFIRDLKGPDRDQLAPFIDPELKAGDLLLMNGHTWHNPPPGTTSEDRCGFFLKYCAVNAPPAAGYYPYNQAAYDSLSAAGKRLIPVHFDRPISTTRLLIESTSNPPPRFLLIHDNERDRWELPGGEASEEEERVGWDVGARIGALQSIIQKELSADIPWMSYIDDVEAENGVCRVYGYIDADQVLESSTEEDSSRRWFTSDRLRDTLGDNDPICRILRSWQRDDILRGKGKAIRQSKNQFD